MKNKSGTFEMVRCEDCGRIVRVDRSRLYPYGDMDELAIEILCQTCFEERCDWDEYQEQKRVQKLFKSQLQF